MDQDAPDLALRLRLSEIPEIAGAGFSVREGLTGGGVTLLKGRTYFGSWRMSMGRLVWVPAKTADPQAPVDSVEEAARQTVLMILRDLQADAAVGRTFRKAS